MTLPRVQNQRSGIIYYPMHWQIVTPPVSQLYSYNTDQWRGKALHGQWPKLMDELRADSFRWLQNAYLKPVIESLLVAAQDRALHTNWLGFHMMRNIDSDLCRRCLQSIYLNCHNAVALAVHWSLCAQYGFLRSEHVQWWQHQLQPVLDNNEYKLLYDCHIFTDRRITARRPDMVCADKPTSCGTWKYSPSHVCENSVCKLLWDFSICY